MFLDLYVLELESKLVQEISSGRLAGRLTKLYANKCFRADTKSQ